MSRKSTVNVHGSSIVLTASNSIPDGYELTAWSPDNAPFTVADKTVSEVKYGPNGNKIKASKVAGFGVTLAVIVGSEDDIVLQDLLEANTPDFDKLSADDDITITVNYANGRGVEYSIGDILSGSPDNGLGTDGFESSGTYVFDFAKRERT